MCRYLVFTFIDTAHAGFMRPWPRPIGRGRAARSGGMMQLSGNLLNFALPELMQVMSSGCKSGVLTIECGDGGALLYFQEGHVVHAQTGELTGEEAFYRVFKLHEGKFSFTGGVVARGQTIFVDNTTLMLEAARLSDEGLPESAHDLERDAPFPVGGELGEFGELSLDSPDYVDFLGWDTPPAEAQGEGDVSFHPHLLEAAGNLSDRLERCPEASGFVVWTRDGLLKGGEEPKAKPSLAAPDAATLAEALDLAEALGETLRAGKLHCIVLTPPSGEREVFFPLSGLMASVWLGKGYRPQDFLARVTSLAELPRGGAAVAGMK